MAEADEALPLKRAIRSAFEEDPPVVPKGAVWMGDCWTWEVFFPAGLSSSAITLSTSHEDPCIDTVNTTKTEEVKRAFALGEVTAGDVS
jgi:hypothetical protein